MDASLAYLPTNDDLFGWQDRPLPVEPWQPTWLDHAQWPPNYRAVYAWRLQQLELLESDPALLASAKAYYSQPEHFAEFVMHWMDTYNPRKEADKWMPFVFFKKQSEFFQMLIECVADQQSGLVEKCRDAGVTWEACAFSICAWLFIPDFAVGWGSRKEDLVDTIGDADSIFEKMRLIVRRLPSCFLPAGLNPKLHLTFCKLLNPENGSIIAGEAGDNIGRGGRKSIVFKDESAHYERPDKIEAALGDNTNVQIDISSVNGLGNVFHRKREAGIDWSPGLKIAPGFTRVCVIDWRDHPEKTQEWYDIRRAKYEREGLLHLFAQEVDRNYSAAIQNTIIEYEWIQAAVDAHLALPEIFKNEVDSRNWSAALDVADEGTDTNALCKLQSVVMRYINEWGERDPGVTTRNTIAECREHRGIKIQYDSIGIGASVKAEFNRLVDEKTLDPMLLRLVPWNAGGEVLNKFDRIIPDDEESVFNKDFFGNMKAQAWWSARTRFYKTWRAVKHGVIYPASELISLDSKMPLLYKLMKELAQPTRGTSSGTLKMIINKKPDGMSSPNLADAAIMAMFPVPEDYGVAAQGHYGNV